MSQMQTKEELVAQLCRLYRLRDEGKRVDKLIEKCEALLFGKIENETYGGKDAHKVRDGRDSQDSHRSR